MEEEYACVQAILILGRYDMDIVQIERWEESFCGNCGIQYDGVCVHPPATHPISDSQTRFLRLQPMQERTYINHSVRSDAGLASS